jgi:hypothetical protein
VTISRLIGIIVLVGALVSFLAAMQNQQRAYHGLANSTDDLRRTVVRRGPFANRSSFSDAGWTYWKRMWRLAGVTFVLMVVGAILVA